MDSSEDSLFPESWCVKYMADKVVSWGQKLLANQTNPLEIQ
jgi:hypothetical protein